MTTTIRQMYATPSPADHLNEAQQPVTVALINRDLSLLEFFRRVLDEALDESSPILERLKFLAIFSANLDEFFMIRVSGLKEKTGNKAEVSPDGYTRPELLAEIKTRVSEMIERQMKCLREDVIPELGRSGIALVDYESLNDRERAEADRYFKSRVYPVLTPQAVDPTHPFPYISGGNVNIALMVRPELNKRVAQRCTTSMSFLFGSRYRPLSRVLCRSEKTVDIC